jgi:hypothetical protein
MSILLVGAGRGDCITMRICKKSHTLRDSSMSFAGGSLGKVVDLDATWTELEQGVELILTRFEEGLSHLQYVKYYT